MKIVKLPRNALRNAAIGFTATLLAFGGIQLSAQAIGSHNSNANTCIKRVPFTTLTHLQQLIPRSAKSRSPCFRNNIYFCKQPLAACPWR